MKQIEKYRGLLDMINGGGANAEGDKFQGGGLLSILANALATPYGSEDRAKEELAAGLLGKTRPVMRPNRPAPSAAPASISAGSAPAPGYTLPGTLAEMSDLARNRAMPLTQASDIPGGFNPADVAPVQPPSTGMTPAPSVAPDFTMPDGSPINPPAPQLSREQIAQKFGNDMVNSYGREKANSIMSSPSAQGIYLHYINNGYQLPAL
jgi:hypothetical protein